MENLKLIKLKLDSGNTYKVLKVGRVQVQESLRLELEICIIKDGEIIITSLNLILLGTILCNKTFVLQEEYTVLVLNMLIEKLTRNITK